MEQQWLIPPERHLVLRTSFIKMFLRCPAQAAFRYFKGLVELPKSYTTYGTCMHKAAEHQNVHKKKKGRDAKLSVLQDVFNEEWRVKSKHTIFTKAEKPEKIKTHGIKQALPVYYEELAVHIEPLYVEEPFSIEFPSVNATLTGQIDLVEEHEIIRDLKTKGKHPGWMDITKSIQAVSYCLGYEAKFGRKPKGFILDYLIRNRSFSGEARFEPSKEREVAITELDEFITLFEWVVTQIRMGLFYPKRENNYLCSPNMCGYWNRCVKRGQWMNVPSTGRTFMENSGKETTEESEDE